MNSANLTKRLLLIDDDPVVAAILLMRIQHACPDIIAETIDKPVALAGFDIYVVDNNFSGRQEAIRLAEAIATVSPGAVIFMLSSFLEVDLLKRAMGAQCRGAFDKRDPDDIDALIRAVATAASERKLELRAEEPRHSRSLVGEVTGLIREWNRRIGAEERRRKPAP